MRIVKSFQSLISDTMQKKTLQLILITNGKQFFYIFFILGVVEQWQWFVFFSKERQKYPVSMEDTSGWLNWVWVFFCFV